MDQVCDVLRFHHYTYNADKSYVLWILQYIRLNGRRTLRIWRKVVPAFFYLLRIAFDLGGHNEAEFDILTEKVDT